MKMTGKLSDSYFTDWHLYFYDRYLGESILILDILSLKFRYINMLSVLERVILS